MRDLIPAVCIASVVWGLTYLATVDWTHPGTRTPPERTRP
jgi:hypothetical protein